ncbi:MFS transporter [Streptomyces sp. NPDC048279]|uniref:MFS transporter n=1 Tax=Streptomyces sp. NPDC048279 TaxID=3154714 RepID=UPI00343458A0
MIVPASPALIRDAFPDSVRRTRAVSVWAMAGSSGAAAGPEAGGLLSQVSWLMIFFVNIPVGLAGLALPARTVPVSVVRCLSTGPASSQPWSRRVP